MDNLPSFSRFHFALIRGRNHFLAALVAALLAACSRSDDNQIRVAHTPKDEPAPASTASAAAPSPDNSALSGLAASATALPAGHPSLDSSTTAPAMSGGPGMTALPGMAEFAAANPAPQWAPPADWVALPANPMRKGSWSVASSSGAAPAEISVNVFAGQLGGLLANVNRWRGQVGLEPNLTDATLATCVANISIGGRSAQLVSLDGPDGRSLAGALVFLPDRVWSFRLFGPTATVTAQRAAFRAFLDSVVWPNG